MMLYVMISQVPTPIYALHIPSQGRVTSAFATDWKTFVLSAGPRS